MYDKNELITWGWGVFPLVALWFALS